MLIRCVGGVFGGKDVEAYWPLSSRRQIWGDEYELETVCLFNIEFPIYVKEGYDWCDSEGNVTMEAWRHLRQATPLAGTPRS